MFNANGCSGENPLARLSRASKDSSSTAHSSHQPPLPPSSKHAPPHFAGPVDSRPKSRLFQPRDRTVNVAPKAAGHAWLAEFEQSEVGRHPAGPDHAFAHLFQHHTRLVAGQPPSAHPWTAQFEATRPQHHVDTLPDQMALLEAAFHRAHLQHTPGPPDAASRITEWSAQFDEARSQWAEKEITADELEADFLQTWHAYEAAAATSEASAGPPTKEHDLPLQDDWAEQFVHHGAQNELDLPYHFEPNNPFLSHADPLSEGMAMIQSPHASLTDTALALEAALQKIDTLGLSDTDVSRAWESLGRTQQENEKEMPALAALQQAIKTNPSNDTALLVSIFFSLFLCEREALILRTLQASAISYINENHDEPARAALGNWIRLTYPEVVGRHTNTHDDLTAAFVAAARLGGRQRGYGAVDPDVQVGLGVLYYASNEHQRAIDCFEAALTVRPMDHVLWNRLGATLANSGKTEAAIDAYSKALSIKPSYVRAHYNLGVGCMNIGCYKEAAEHFLGALSTHHKQHGTTDGVSHHLFGISTTLWDTLRRAFYAMDRGDLAVLAKPSGTDLAVFRNDFDF